MNRLESESLMDLTTLALVKAQLKQALTDNTADDAYLSSIIAFVSRWAMLDILNRGVKKMQRVDYLDINWRQKKFYLVAPPIDLDESFEILISTTQPRDWTNNPVVIDNTKYLVDPPRADVGLVELLYEYGPGSYFFYYQSAILNPNSPLPGALRVSYTGGMAEATESSGEGGNAVVGFVDLYPDIAYAITCQVVYLWQNKLRYGIQSEGMVGASFTMTRPFNWLPFVRETLELHSCRTV